MPSNSLQSVPRWKNLFFGKVDFSRVCIESRGRIGDTSSEFGHAGFRSRLRPGYRSSSFFVFFLSFCRQFKMTVELHRLVVRYPFQFIFSNCTQYELPLTASSNNHEYDWSWGHRKQGDGQISSVGNIQKIPCILSCVYYTYFIQCSANMLDAEFVIIRWHCKTYIPRNATQFHSIFQKNALQMTWVDM